MPFVKGDKNINRAGRPKGQDLLKNKSKSEIGSEDLHKMLRGLKPLQRKALAKLGIILEEGSEAAKMKAIILVLKEYKDLVQQLYIDADDSEDDDEDKEPIEKAPLLRLTVADKT